MKFKSWKDAVAAGSIFLALVAFGYVVWTLAVVSGPPRIPF